MTTHTLTALDATFLELEDADASAHMHTGGILVFDALPDGTHPTVDDVRRHVESRLPALPRYRQRLSSDRVGRFGRPAWTDVDGFDVSRHVRRATLPPPGRWEDLLEWAEDFYSQRLDRTAPLWEMVFVDGLADGHWALCTKTHHCLVDGVGAVDVATLLLDVDPHPQVDPSVAAAAEAAAQQSGRDEPSPWVQLVRTTMDVVRHPRHAGDVVERATAMAELLVRDEVIACPATSLNRPIGGRRRLRGVRLDVAEARTITAALGGTINDVALTGVTGGLRALLESRGEPLPRQGLRAMVPVNLRRDAQRHELGNRITSLFVSLPVAEASVLGRFEVVREHTRTLKASDQALGSDTVIKVAGITPPLLHSTIARALFGKRLFNVTVTNVPGPPVPLYALGARLRTIYPLVPLAAEHAIGIAIISYDGHLSFGVNADRDTVRDVDVFCEGVVDTLAELERLAHAAAATGAAAVR